MSDKTADMLAAAERFLVKNGWIRHPRDLAELGDAFTAFALSVTAQQAQQIEDLTRERDKWRMALESLTPQGSEFHNDLPRCVDHIQRQRNREHQTSVQAVKDRQAAEVEVARLREIIIDIVEIDKLKENVKAATSHSGGEAEEI